MADDLNIDPQALRVLPKSVAELYDIVPMAVSGDNKQLLVATGAQNMGAVASELGDLLNMELVMVSSPAEYREALALAVWQDAPSETQARRILDDTGAAIRNAYRHEVEESISVISPSLLEEVHARSGDAVIDPNALDMLPRNVAEMYAMVPLAMSKDGKKLLIAIGEAHEGARADLASLLGMEVVAVKDVREYVATTRNADEWGKLPSGATVTKIMDDVPAAVAKLYTDTAESKDFIRKIIDGTDQPGTGHQL